MSHQSILMAAPAQQLKQLFLSQSTRKERGCSLSLPHPPHLCCKSLRKQQPSYRCLGIVLPFPEPELQSKSECLCWVRDELRGATAETLLWLIPNPPSHHSGLGWSLLASLFKLFLMDPSIEFVFEEHCSSTEPLTEPAQQELEALKDHGQTLLF